MIKKKLIKRHMNIKKLKKDIEKYKKMIDQIDKLYDEICAQLIEFLRIISPNEKYKIDGYEWPYITIHKDDDDYYLSNDDDRYVRLEDILEKEYGFRNAIKILSTTFDLSDEELEKLKEVMDES